MVLPNQRQFLTGHKCASLEAKDENPAGQIGSVLVVAVPAHRIIPCHLVLIHQPFDLLAQPIGNRQRHMSRFGKLAMEFGFWIEGLGMVLSMIFICG